MSDLAAYRGMTLEESRDLISDYQDVHGLQSRSVVEFERVT